MPEHQKSNLFILKPPLTLLMADGIGIVSGMLMGWITQPLIWMIIIFLFLGLTVGLLFFRKKKLLKYTVIEVVDHGSGKFSLNTLKAGYFGKNVQLKGLWWSGEEVLRTGTGEIIANFSTEDYQEINGKRGIVCIRDPNNQDVLVPISAAQIKNKELLLEIAPRSYREAAIDIYRQTTKETKDWKDKLVQFGGWALVVIFSLISIIIITKMVQHGQAEAKDLILQAGEILKDAGGKAAMTSIAPFFMFIKKKWLSQ